MHRAQREHRIGTIKYNKEKMAKKVAYPDLALDKLIGTDPSENPAAFIRLLTKN